MKETDPRVRRTRKLLQDAFMELVGEKSFHAISVQDIAERATLNRATFYAHFEDKYALIDYILHEQFREALERRLAPAAPFTRGNLHRLAVTVFEFLILFNGHCAPPTRADLEPMPEVKVQEELYAFLLNWLAPVPLVERTPGVTREAIASALSWAIFGAASAWSRGEQKIPAEESARQVLAVLMDGIAQLLSVPDVARPDARNGVRHAGAAPGASR
jgi:AcrR family transcriptional regulator